MLTIEPDARPNASALLRHKWIGASKPALMKNGLEDSKARLREFNAKRKLKGAMNAVKATNAMKNVIAGMRPSAARASTSSGSAGSEE